jgi:hypothetical protein
VVRVGSLSGEGAAVDVDKFLTDKDDVFDVDDESDDDDFTRDLPLNMSDDEVKGLLFAYPASRLNMTIGSRSGKHCIINIIGGDVGFDLWVSWSALSSKHDARMMRKKYNSFGKWSGARVTMAVCAGTLNNKAVWLLRCLIRCELRRKALVTDIAITWRLRSALVR